MAPEIGKRYINGKDLLCPICQHDQFWSRRTVLHGGRLQLFLELGWAGRRAVNHVCAQCGYVTWFLPVRPQ